MDMSNLNNVFLFFVGLVFVLSLTGLLCYHSSLIARNRTTLGMLSMLSMFVYFVCRCIRQLLSEVCVCVHLWHAPLEHSHLQDASPVCKFWVAKSASIASASLLCLSMICYDGCDGNGGITGCGIPCS